MSDTKQVSSQEESTLGWYCCLLELNNLQVSLDTV